MKRLLSIIVLFSLVLASVPREWVHSCDHDHVSEMHHDHDNDQNQDDDDVFESDDCFACDITIDNSNGPVAPVQYSNFAPTIKITKGYIKSIESILDLPYALRGPPVG